MDRALDTIRVHGAEIHRYNAVQPAQLAETAIKWDGEWQVTIEVFRDFLDTGVQRLQLRRRWRNFFD